MILSACAVRHEEWPHFTFRTLDSAIVRHSYPKRRDNQRSIIGVMSWRRATIQTNWNHGNTISVSSAVESHLQVPPTFLTTSYYSQVKRPDCLIYDFAYDVNFLRKRLGFSCSCSVLYVQRLTYAMVSGQAPQNDAFGKYSRWKKSWKEYGTYRLTAHSAVLFSYPPYVIVTP